MGLMKKRRSVKFIAGMAAIATIVAGLAAAGAVAASKALSPSEESKAVIEDAAGQLGIEPDELSGALDRVKYERDAMFNLDVPTSCPDVPATVLTPGQVRRWSIVRRAAPTYP